MSTIAPIVVRGREFAVRLPPLDLQQDLLYAQAEAGRKGGWKNLRRVYAAAVALCVPEVAFDLKMTSTSAARESLADFGGDVFSALVGVKSWTQEEVIEAGAKLVAVVASAGAFPTEVDVKAAVGNSGGAGG